MNSDKKGTMIPETSSAIILNEDGSCNLVLSHQEDDEDISEANLIAAAVANVIVKQDPRIQGIVEDLVNRKL